MSLENVPEISCLYDRSATCPEGICPLYKKNEDHIKQIIWKLRKKEFMYYRLLFEREGVNINAETICNLLLNPQKFNKSTVEGQYQKFTADQKKFGELIANMRRSYIDKYDNPVDSFKILCPVKRERAYSHT